MRTETKLLVPSSAVAAAGRALKYLIADLTNRIYMKEADYGPITKQMLEKEIMDMMDANKAMFSALPASPDTGAAKLAKALDNLLGLVSAGDKHMAEAVNARAALAAWKEVSCRPSLMQIDCVTP